MVFASRTYSTNGTELIPDSRCQANGTTANSTVNIFIDGECSDMQYVASIVTACVDQTIYAIQCTAGPIGIDPLACGPNAAIVTATSAPSEYRVSVAGTSTFLDTPATGTIMGSCALVGTTAVTCSVTIKGTAAGTAVSTSAVDTLSGANYYRFDVQITGGAEKTANPTATCAPKKGTTAALSTNHVAMFALAGIVGIVNFLL